MAAQPVRGCAAGPAASQRRVEALPTEFRLGLVDPYVTQAERLGWSPESLARPPRRVFSKGDLVLFVIPEPTEDGIAGLVVGVTDLSQAC